MHGRCRLGKWVPDSKLGSLGVRAGRPGSCCVTADVSAQSQRWWSSGPRSCSLRNSSFLSRGFSCIKYMLEPATSTPLPRSDKPHTVSAVELHVCRTTFPLGHLGGGRRRHHSRSTLPRPPDHGWRCHQQMGSGAPVGSFPIPLMGALCAVIGHPTRGPGTRRALSSHLGTSISVSSPTSP